ncbi:hypothetical protein T12_3427 [Trichinella patagoniensis]|uniref:Uncharacterized protein n=1 Tax=Trichinella patagoniensis TaxID=990121 RepID=A0A0V0Z0V5_9BILA|nr:hypothetical protein T12_3427 [Trichinella patagoniensis]
MVHTLSNLEAIVHNPQIHEMELMAEHILSHVLILLPIGGNDVVSLALQTPCNVRGNEASSPGDRDTELLRWPVRLPLQVRIGVLPIVDSIASSAGHSATG